MSRPHCIAVIHARGGSRRLPLKNIADLGGRPLVAWCIEAALQAECLDRVIVSTDHDGIAAAARAAGAEVPFRRPAELAEDVPSELVTRHAVAFHEDESGRTVDIAVTIQPTTPFLRGADIDGCIGLLVRHPDRDSAFTMVPVHERPEWMYRADGDGVLTPYTGTRVSGEAGVSQNLEPLHHANGGAYATRRETLFSHDSVVGLRPAGWPMSRMRSVDIDDAVDLMIAEAVARHLAEHPEQ